jgi:hypothetical protein
LTFRHGLLDHSISANAATALLDQIRVKRTVDPQVDTRRGLEKTQKPNEGAGPKKQRKLNAGVVAEPNERPEFEMRADRQQMALEGQIRKEAEAAQRRRVTFVSAWFVAGLGMIVAGVVVHRRNTEKRITRLVYELDTVEKQKHSIVQQAFANLIQCHRMWRIESRSSTHDWKRNAGASSLVRRTQVLVGTTVPPFTEVNVPVSFISTTGWRLFFLPDMILCLANGQYGAVSYEDFHVEQSVTRFIEEEAVPVDATVVDRTWRFVNKNGGPDRRFNNNVQIPIAQYGMLLFSSSTGLNMHINTSNAEKSALFALRWRELRAGNPHKGAANVHPPPLPFPPPPQQKIYASSTPQTKALQVLGLSAGASIAEISEAYHRLAQMYHPDKVAGLGPEFGALADTKMKEINASYNILKVNTS